MALGWMDYSLHLSENELAYSFWLNGFRSSSCRLMNPSVCPTSSITTNHHLFQLHSWTLAIRGLIRGLVYESCRTDRPCPRLIAGHADSDRKRACQWT